MTARSVLVTGALGYLGGRLVQHLASAGLPVVGTSRAARPTPDGWPSGARMVQLDPGWQITELTAALQGVETIVHLSAANEHESARDPDKAVIDTGLGTRRLLEAAIAAGARRFIFLSTIHVYGSPLPARLDEEAALQPQHPYAISHRVGEDFVLAADRAGSIEGLVVRLSNGIGAPAWVDVDRWTLVGNDLARQVVATGEMKLLTSGLQWRDFITLRDFCCGIQLLIDTDTSALQHRIFNLGGHLPLRVIDVAEEMAGAAQRVMGFTPPIARPESADLNQHLPIQFPTERLDNLGFQASGSRHLDDELDSCLVLLQKSKGK